MSIVLELSEAIFFYLLFSVVGIFLLWFFQEKRRTSASMPKFEDRVMWKCSICLYDYIDSRHAAIAVCPRCGSYNERSAAHETDKERGNRDGG